MGHMDYTCMVNFFLAQSFLQPFTISLGFLSMYIVLVEFENPQQGILWCLLWHGRLVWMVGLTEHIGKQHNTED